MVSRTTAAKTAIALLAAVTLLCACSTKTTLPPAVTPASPSSAPVAAPDATIDYSRQPVAQPVVESQSVQTGLEVNHNEVFGLKRVFFPYNQFTLDGEALATMAANAAFLNKYPALQVIIEGHCDERGSDEYNLALGERRAAAVRSYLQAQGIAAGRLTVISYGEEKPLVSGAGEDAWAQNRRAEFKVAR